MDLSYPLVFTRDGAIATLEDSGDGTVSAQQMRAHILHMLDTVTGERFLYPDFGVDIKLLFHAVAPELACEKFRLSLAQLTGVYSRVSISRVLQNRISLKVEFSTDSVVVSYG